MTKTERDICEMLGWRVEETTLDDDVNLQKYSPAGEDFWFSVERNQFASNVLHYAKHFDTDEHAAETFRQRQNGDMTAPSSLREAIDDADAIKRDLTLLGETLGLDNGWGMVAYRNYDGHHDEEDAHAHNMALDTALREQWRIYVGIVDGNHFPLCDGQPIDFSDYDVVISHLYGTHFFSIDKNGPLLREDALALLCSDNYLKWQYRVLSDFDKDARGVANNNLVLELEGENDDGKRRGFNDDAFMEAFNPAESPKSFAYVLAHDTGIRRCNRCGSVVLTEEPGSEYPYQCMYCDEDMFEVETHIGHLHTSEEFVQLCCTVRDTLLLDD